MKNLIRPLGLFLFALLAFINLIGQQAPKPVDYVNTRIGNMSHLLVPTFPTTHLPNGMIRMIPAHRDFVTVKMDGLPLNVPSHRQGEVLLLKPFAGDIAKLSPSIQYNYDFEVSKPYYYTVLLDDYNIKVEFAPAAKSGIYNLSFMDDEPAYIMIATKGSGDIQVRSETISGYENYNGIKHYFYLEFEKKPIQSGRMDTGKNSAVYVRFSDKNVAARYAVSYISVEQAQKNLRKEIKSYDLQAVSNAARMAWNEQLGKIKIEGGSEDQKTTFYTALYRSYERPVNISEDGKYFSGFDKKIHEDNGIPFWTDDWIWDTHLALHPLRTILNPRQEEEVLHSYIRMYEQSGWMPTFPAVFGDMHAMNGNHAAITFADALQKGLKFDVGKAFEGMKQTVLTETMIPWKRGPKTALDDFYQQHGWFPALHPGQEENIKEVNSFELRQAVAVTQAASYDDWAIARLAKKLSKKDEFDYFEKRSYNYRNLFNKKTGFFHPKDSAGNFIEPFDYIFSGGIGARAYYDENNAWTYIWDVKQDIADLINLFGGNLPFTAKLDRLFVEDLKKPRWQYYAVMPDATGNVGQFVMGNEPSFHIPYLYNYVGQPWKTQKRIRMLMESWFRNDLMGICGDEDGGGMSAFYVFSAMGFYPPSAGIPVYTIGSPLFTKVTINLDSGKKFTVIAKNSSWSNKYIIAAKLNGKDLNRTWFTHQDIVNGGVLELQMSNIPNKNWAIGADAAPPSRDIDNK